MLLLLIVLRDVFQTALVPRGKVAFRAAPFMVRDVLWPLMRSIVSRFKSVVWQAELFGLFAPLFVIFLLVMWMTFLMLAYGLITYSLAS